VSHRGRRRFRLKGRPEMKEEQGSKSKGRDLAF
jgi:hypothetical protein